MDHELFVEHEVHEDQQALIDFGQKLAGEDHDDDHKVYRISKNILEIFESMNLERDRLGWLSEKFKTSDSTQEESSMSSIKQARNNSEFGHQERPFDPFSMSLKSSHDFSLSSQGMDGEMIPCYRPPPLRWQKSTERARIFPEPPPLVNSKAVQQSSPQKSAGMAEHDSSTTDSDSWLPLLHFEHPAHRTRRGSSGANFENQRASFRHASGIYHDDVSYALDETIGEFLLREPAIKSSISSLRSLYAVPVCPSQNVYPLQDDSMDLAIRGKRTSFESSHLRINGLVKRFSTLRPTKSLTVMKHKTPQAKHDSDVQSRSTRPVSEATGTENSKLRGDATTSAQIHAPMKNYDQLRHAMQKDRDAMPQPMSSFRFSEPGRLSHNLGVVRHRLNTSNQGKVGKGEVAFTAEAFDKFEDGKLCIFLALNNARELKDEQMLRREISRAKREGRTLPPDWRPLPMEKLKFDKDLDEEARLAAQGHDRLVPTVLRRYTSVHDTRKPPPTEVTLLEVNNHIQLLGPAGLGAMATGVLWLDRAHHKHSSRATEHDQPQGNVIERENRCPCRNHLVWDAITDEAYKFAGIARTEKEGRWIVHLAKQKPKADIVRDDLRDEPEATSEASSSCSDRVVENFLPPAYLMERRKWPARSTSVQVSPHHELSGLKGNDGLDSPDLDARSNAASQKDIDAEMSIPLPRSALTEDDLPTRNMAKRNQPDAHLPSESSATPVVRFNDRVEAPALNTSDMTTAGVNPTTILPPLPVDDEWSRWTRQIRGI